MIVSYILPMKTSICVVSTCIHVYVWYAYTCMCIYVNRPMCIYIFLHIIRVPDIQYIVYIKQVLSEKAKLAKKIREYNRKTTPVNHIHIKGAHCVSWIER